MDVELNKPYQPVLPREFAVFRTWCWDETVARSQVDTIGHWPLAM